MKTMQTPTAMDASMPRAGVSGRVAPLMLLFVVAGIAVFAALRASQQVRSVERALTRGGDAREPQPLAGGGSSVQVSEEATAGRDALDAANPPSTGGESPTVPASAVLKPHELLEGLGLSEVRLHSYQATDFAFGNADLSDFRMAVIGADVQAGMLLEALRQGTGTNGDRLRLTMALAWARGFSTQDADEILNDLRSVMGSPLAAGGESMPDQRCAAAVYALGMQGRSATLESLLLGDEEAHGVLGSLTDTGIGRDMALVAAAVIDEVSPELLQATLELIGNEAREVGASQMAYRLLALGDPAASLAALEAGSGLAREGLLAAAHRSQEPGFGRLQFEQLMRPAGEDVFHGYSVAAGAGGLLASGDSADLGRLVDELERSSGFRRKWLEQGVEDGGACKSLGDLLEIASRDERLQGELGDSFRIASVRAGMRLKAGHMSLAEEARTTGSVAERIALLPDDSKELDIALIILRASSDPHHRALAREHRARSGQ